MLQWVTQDVLMDRIHHVRLSLEHNDVHSKRRATDTILRVVSIFLYRSKKHTGLSLEISKRLQQLCGIRFTL